MAGSTTLLWVAAGVIGLISVAPGIDRAVSDDRRADAAVDGQIVTRAPDGQFYLDGRIGETPVRFMFDPDSDQVLIAGPDAERAGLPTSGANVTLESLSVGPKRRHGLTARIAPSMPVSSLGRAQLHRFMAAEVRGDRLILR